MSLVEQETVTAVPSILDPRVERGAAFLDETSPGWFDEVNLSDFDLSDCNKCVLGYVGWEVQEGLPRKNGDMLMCAVARYGFYVFADTEDERETGYAALEQDWRLAILSRRQTA